MAQRPANLSKGSFVGKGDEILQDFSCGCPKFHQNPRTGAQTWQGKLHHVEPVWGYKARHYGLHFNLLKTLLKVDLSNQPWNTTCLASEADLTCFPICTP